MTAGPVTSPATRAATVRFGEPVTARTPASSANLGPGFDSMGLALAVHDEVTAEAFDLAAVPDGAPTVEVEVTGAGAGAVPLGEEHLVVRSLRAGLAHAGVAATVGLRLSCRNAIPLGRGLGSSASAIVVGLRLAQGLLDDPSSLTDEELFALATAAEGHPDNASAAQYGGCTLSWVEPGGPRVVQVAVAPAVRAVVCVPDVELATSRARAMLPQSVPHADAAFTAGRAALLVHALTQRPDLLLAATEERLHQSQRAPAMPDTAELLRAVRDRGEAAVVSGAGPSLLVLGVGEGPERVVRSVLDGRAPGGVTWQVLPVAIDHDGTVVIE